MPPAEADGIWLFDGVCNFCSGSVNLFLRMDRREDVIFVPLQSAFGRQLALGAGLDPDEPVSFVFFDRGRALKKSAAVLALMDHLPAPWRWGRIIGVLPRPMLDVAYDWLAANRYRLMGRKAACMVPDALVRRRFRTEPLA